MASAKEKEAAIIAADWGIDAGLLSDVVWNIEKIERNGSESYSYLVRFDKDTDRNTLSILGVAQGEFTRQLSLNAFDDSEDQEALDRRDARRVGRIQTKVVLAKADKSSTPQVSAAPQVSDYDPDDEFFSFEKPFPDITDFIGDDLEFEDPPERQIDLRRAYYLDGRRLTPSQFGRLSNGQQVRAMVQWFHQNYEDPAVRMPYESREGGYHWIWGGPYNAREQIGDQFSGIAREDAIEAAALEVEKDGLLEWAPKARREDYELQEDWNEPGVSEDWNEPGVIEDYNKAANHRSDPKPEGEAYLTDEFGRFLTDGEGRRLVVSRPIGRSASSNFSDFRFGESNFGASGPVEAQRDFHRELLAKLENLEASLQTYKENLPPRSHNQPPELVEPDPISTDEIRMVVQVTVDMRTEAARAQPDPAMLEMQASKLKAVANSILAWLGRKGDLAVDSAIKWAIPAIGAAWLLADPKRVLADLLAVAETASSWAQQLLAGM